VLTIFFHFIQADPRFVWNKNLLEELIEAKLDEFIIPLIQGNIQNFQKISLHAIFHISIT